MRRIYKQFQAPHLNTTDSAKPAFLEKGRCLEVFFAYVSLPMVCQVQSVICWLILSSVAKAWKLFPSQCVKASGCNGTEVQGTTSQTARDMVVKLLHPSKFDWRCDWSLKGTDLLKCKKKMQPDKWNNWISCMLTIEGSCLFDPWEGCV